MLISRIAHDITIHYVLNYLIFDLDYITMTRWLFGKNKEKGNIQLKIYLTST
jgi:hypothetical protein